MDRFHDSGLVDKVVAKVRALREAKGTTLQEFYDDTGIHLARIEADRRDITLSTLKRICQYFGIPMSDFLKGMDK